MHTSKHTTSHVSKWRVYYYEDKRFLLHIWSFKWDNLLKPLTRRHTFPRLVCCFISSTGYCILKDFSTGLLEFLGFSETSNSYSLSPMRQTMSSSHCVPGFVAGKCNIYVIVIILWKHNMNVVTSQNIFFCFIHTLEIFPTGQGCFHNAIKPMKHQHIQFQLI